MRRFSFFILNHLSIFVFMPRCLISDCSLIRCNLVALIPERLISSSFFFLKKRKNDGPDSSRVFCFFFFWHLNFYTHFRLSLSISTPTHPHKSARISFGTNLYTEDNLNFYDVEYFNSCLWYTFLYLGL